MRVAVDTRFLQDDLTSDYENFTKEVFLNIAKQHPKDQFIFLYDQSTASLSLPQNASLVKITPPPTNFFLYKWWYDVKVASALKKHEADVFICPYGLCSLTTKVPQVLIIPDLAIASYSAFLPKNALFFYKKYISRFIKKAKSVSTLSAFTKEELVKMYKIPQEKITVIGGAATDIFKVLSEHEKESIKAKYAQGCEYFIFTGGLDSQHNTMTLLKAFSIFKKWQKTNMKLVIVGDTSARKKEIEKINTYKYKNDIFLTGHLSQQELAAIIGSAYAMIFPSLHSGFCLPVLQAMQCEVPVITSPGNSMTEISDDAALYADPQNANEIADQMKLIFKDENLRTRLIEAGKERSKLFSCHKTAESLWRSVEQALIR